MDLVFPKFLTIDLDLNLEEGHSGNPVRVYGRVCHVHQLL